MSMFRANGLDLHVEEVAPIGAQRGTAVLIHGMTSDSMASWFLTLAHPLAEAGLRVLLYDLRGHGRSARPATGYRLADFVGDLAALLAHWAPGEPVHLLGNSFGGTVAFAYAAKRPAEVAGIVTVESSPPTAAWFARMRDRLHAALRNLPGMAQTRRTKDALALLTGTTIVSELPASDLPDVTGVTCPVLCLYGAESRVHELAADTERLLPQSKHVIIPGQKHTLLINAPGEVRAEVLPWLTATTAAT
ncbi:alpha/beta fold hydrolase [Actinoplanes sp. N902-109]|uniref:alpha/beta fold hydrolase n=1 Tax=Actinoplanes sp. (strain N902-109) TaxID=649831 RepID=UPI0003295EC2|nr:alpha/beta hydrolase [Actinoplanes sp. N902-109]AGL21063.1 hydrolase [Actinoplanes sp. N902-109]